MTEKSALMPFEEVEDFINRVRDSGYRGLLIIGGNRGEIIEDLADIVERKCILIGDKDVRQGHCRVERSPARYYEILGLDSEMSIVSLDSVLRPSIIAAVAETVKGGGVLALVGPEWSSWNVGPREGRGAYKRYFERMIPNSRLHLWADIVGSRMRIYSLRTDIRPRSGLTKPRYKSRAGVPKIVLESCKTRDQAEALDRLFAFLKGRGRVFLLLGDRGRGKSFVSGMALSVAVKFRLLGRAAVIGPHPLRVQNVFQGLIYGLRKLRVHYSTKRDGGGNTVRVKGKWFHISFEPPTAHVSAPVAVIDEAASIGPVRARRIARSVPKTIISTTIHGYEGSGRSFALLLKKQLPKPLEEYRLQEPIRYPPSDPLEEWLLITFMLDAEPPDIAETVNPEFYSPSSSELPEDYSLLRQVVGVLREAHYRFTPDILMLILEAEHHSIYTLRDSSSKTVFAVADIVYETGAKEEEAKTATGRLNLMIGPREILPWIKLYRISRIAVSPALQRKGYGSTLLRRVEEHLASKGASIIATLFSRLEVIPFWMRNEYLPFYMSPRYNRLTGEKNVGMIKALSSEGREIVEEAYSNFRLRLVESSHSIYRDVEAEVILELLKSRSRECSPIPINLTPNMQWRLRIFVEGLIGHEQAFDSLSVALKLILRRCTPPSLSGNAGIAVIARILQGKDLGEVARILGVSQDQALRIVEETLRSTIMRAGRVN